MVKDQNILLGGATHKEESVEELLAKLAQKGKKVKLLDESASVKELPAHEEDDGDLEREEEAPSSIKKKMNKIKNQRQADDDNQDDQSAKKLLEQ